MNERKEPGCQCPGPARRAPGLATVLAVTNSSLADAEQTQDGLLGCALGVQLLVKQ